MKKLLFMLPFCVAAAAAVEPQTQTVIYKPVEGTTSFTMKGTSNERREGSWTNKTTSETSTAFMQPTRSDSAVFEVNDANVSIDQTHDTISVGDLNWSHLAISYQMPKALTLTPGSSIEFSYSLSEANTKRKVTVTLEDRVINQAIVSGSCAAGMGITPHVACGNYYDDTVALENLEDDRDFKGVITCAQDGSYTLTFGSVANIGTAEEMYIIEYTNTSLTSFTLSNVVISMDAGLQNITSGDLIAPPALSALTITYKTTTPEPATATLSLLALAGLAARRRRK